MSPESIGIFIGVGTLLFGILDARRTHAQSLNQHRLQAILAVSESFRARWENGWSDVLDQLESPVEDASAAETPQHQTRHVRFMLNWVDWLGALNRCGAIPDLSILTSSLRFPLTRIITVGRPIIESDVKHHGAKFWQNLWLVAQHLEIPWIADVLSTNDATRSAWRRKS